MSSESSAAQGRRGFDLRRTQMQATGSVWLPSGVTLAEAVSIVDDLGIDPRTVRLVGSASKQIGMGVDDD
jgi:hypothetical protein